MLAPISGDPGGRRERESARERNAVDEKSQMESNKPTARIFSGG